MKQLPIFVNEPATMATGTANIVGKHRYSLSRKWEWNKPEVLFIGLNPSTATAAKNDPTITRCENFAKSWGCGGMWMGNLYSYITAYPDELIANMNQAIDYSTDSDLFSMIQGVQLVICAWGNWNFTTERAKEVYSMIMSCGRVPHCLGINKNGSPKHPLYLPADSQPIKFTI